MATQSSSPRRANPVGTPTHVSEPAYEFLLHAIIAQVEKDCLKEFNKQMKKKIEQKNVRLNRGIKAENEKDTNDENASENGNCSDVKTTIEKQPQTNDNDEGDEEESEERQKQLILMNENIAAKMERMGFDVGYRLVERLAQSKSLVPQSAHSKTPTQAMLHLEAVKFICKEFWTEVFQNQIEKLQTNHRGTFVLKDGAFKWLDRMPSDIELARTMAIKLLALPCGLIRGALSNLGIAAIVSCDFMDDGKNMNSCSFNIKIK
jgi:hypothetical protein